MSGQNNELTAQEETFVSAYIRNGLKDGKAAAIEADYSANTAKSQASRLLKRPKIKARIAEVRQELKRATGFTTKAYTEELERLAGVAESGEKPALGAAVKAQELIGKVHGVARRHPDRQ